MQTVPKILIPWYRYPPFSETQTGGLSVVLWDLSQNLAKIGLKVDCITPKEIGQEQIEMVGDVTVRRDDIGEKFLRGGRLESAGKRFLESFDSVLSVENFGSKCLSNLKEEIKVVRQIHTVASDRPISTYLSLKPDPLEYFKMYLARRRLMQSEKRLNGILSICVSRYVLATMERYNLESKKNLQHIPNGLNLENFLPKKVETRRDLLHIGRFQKVKGLDVLIRSLNSLSKMGKTHSLGIVGNFSEGERKFCLSLAFTETRKQIEFLGHIPHDQLPQVLNSSRLLVAPSRYESFCLPVLEALACGLPVVASNLGGIPELVEEGLGLLVEPDNSESLAQVISKALGDDSLVDSAKTLGPKKASNYDWKKLAPSIASLLR